ncbi:inositol monophosphatase [Gemmatimonas sp.]|uniref:inositol monophosphatase family protein n=2 Tax=Gemmatimonas sp. TaxID=1962908 RepID=UPI003569177A
MTSSAHPKRQDWRDAAIAAADTAARFITHEAMSHRTLTWEEKSATDFVSRVDVGAEERIRDMITMRIPGIRMVGEELSADAHPNEGLVAIVDPLDGTTNFLHGFPNYCVSICIALDGVPQAAVVHDVARGGVLHATASDGAFVDSSRLRVSTTGTPARALIGTGIPFKDVSHADRYLRQLGRLMPIISGVRRAGSAALDLSDVARGRFDGFWELFLHPWDLAAGVLLVREAGGRVTDLEGRNARLAGGPIVASNGILHDWFLDMLNDDAVPAPNPA